MIVPTPVTTNRLNQDVVSRRLSWEVSLVPADCLQCVCPGEETTHLQGVGREGECECDMRQVKTRRVEKEESSEPWPHTWTEWSQGPGSAITAHSRQPKDVRTLGVVLRRLQVQSILKQSHRSLSPRKELSEENSGSCLFERCRKGCHSSF